jgi:hypothetical protein
MKAAKKHQTDVRYCLKKIKVIMHDRVIRIASRCVRFTLDIKSGGMVAAK